MSEKRREARIRALLPLVRRLARRVHRMVPRADFSDLVGDGSLGSIRAVDGYDPQRGASLEQFAVKVILGAMLNGLRRMDPVSERARRTIRKAERTQYDIAGERGSMPSVAEVTQRHPELGRAACAAYRGSPLSLDAPLPPGETLPIGLGDDPAYITAEQDEREYLRALVESLPERQRRVMLAHYYGRASLRCIGAAWNISSQRASQIHLAAIARLRKALDAPSTRA